jgi:putative hemolysin
MRMLARFAAPVVVLLTGPTNLVLRLFGVRVSAEPSITVEEIRALIEQGAESGALDDHEHQIVENVFRFGDRLVSDIMTPRTQLDCLDASASPDIWREQVARRPSSRYLVCEDNIDQILGVVFAEDLLAQCAAGQPLDVRVALRQPLYVPGTMPALSLLEQMRDSHRHVAVAIDEYGGVEGVVLLDTLIDSVVNEPNVADESPASTSPGKEDRSWTMPGATALADVEAALDMPDIPDEDRHGVRTLGGFIMNLLGRVPALGERVEWRGVEFEVAAMHGRTITSVTVKRTQRHNRSAPGDVREPLAIDPR